MSSSLVPIRPPEPNPTILLVNDSPARLRHLQSVLESDSYKVETARGGAEAMRCMQAGCSPEVVVLDLHRPAKAGLETLRLMLKLQPEVKVIMLSGGDDPGQMRRAVSSGAQVYLVKPVPRLYLSAAVKRCLASDRSRPTGNYLVAAAK